MADEFAKGLAIATTAGLGWLVLAGWYTTESFGSGQLTAAPPENLDAFGQFALALKEVLFWFAIFGMLTFWVLVPVFNQVRDRYVTEGE